MVHTVMKVKYVLVLCAVVFALHFPVGGRIAAAMSATDSSGFVVLTDVAPDAIMEARYYSLYNFIGDRVRGYEEPGCAGYPGSGNGITGSE